MAQLSYPYMTTEKNIALTIWIFVDKVLSLLFNTLSKFVIAFLPSLFFFIAFLPKLMFTQNPIHEYLRQSQNSVYCLIPFMWHFGKERILGTERRLLVAGGCERIRSLMALIARVAPSLNEPICWNPSNVHWKEWILPYVSSTLINLTVKNRKKSKERWHKAAEAETQITPEKLWMRRKVTWPRS